ncbi:hypothetical protein SUNI508_05966 [Seiridium unicorne]|uniref:Uncharacterized protein n=1 Tax=Seiridium unicorne TaxID=138068 RepID=A0ABR2V2I3_9PEZI
MSAAPVQTGYDEDFHQVGQQASMTELMRMAGATGLRRRAVSLGVDHWKTFEWCRSEPWLPSGFGEMRQFPDWTKSWADSAAGVAVRIRVLPAMSASAVRPQAALSGTSHNPFRLSGDFQGHRRKQFSPNK